MCDVITHANLISQLEIRMITLGEGLETGRGHRGLLKVRNVLFLDLSGATQLCCANPSSYVLKEYSLCIYIVNYREKV